MKNITGSPVEGDDFFGRENEIQFIWEKLQDGNSIILPAPRRVGKSSFSKKLLEVARKDRWETMEINLEQVHTEAAFLELLLEKLKTLSWWEKIKDRVGDLLKQIKALKPKLSYAGAEVSFEWQSEKADLYRNIGDLLNHQKDTLIFFDELGVLLSSITQNEGGKTNAEHLLHWLRSLRQVSGTRIRWIFCSSVGIENFTFAHQLSNTINDLTAYQLKAFDETTSLKLLNALAESKGIKLPDEVKRAMLDKIRFYLPFFLQILFAKIHELTRLENLALETRTVEKAYRAILDENHLNTWVERLKEQYDDLEADAFLLLKHICQEQDGSKRDNLLPLLNKKHNTPDVAEDRLNSLLYMLKNDGYLMDEDGRYHFRSPLIRDFWFNRFVK